jgi:DNA-binding Lrp family transcriptional regulator
MTTAFMLLNTEIGAENQVLKTLRKIHGVEEAHGLWGVYDLIVNIRAHDIDELKDITKHICDIGQINSKLTMIVSEHSPLSFMNKKSSEPIRSEEPMSILV